MKCWTNSPSKTFTDYFQCMSECNVGSTSALRVGGYQTSQLDSSQAARGYIHICKSKHFSKKSKIRSCCLKEAAWYSFGQTCGLSTYTQTNRRHKQVHTHWLKCIWLQSFASTAVLSEESTAELCLNVRMHFSSVSLIRLHHSSMLWDSCINMSWPFSSLLT